MGKFIQMKVTSKHETTKSGMRVTAKIPVFLALCLFSAQIIAVQHSHNGDLAHDLECSICVKQNSECDYLSTEGHESKNIVFQGPVWPCPNPCKHVQAWPNWISEPM